MAAALAAYERGDYAAALKELLPLADGGNARAQVMAGMAYEFGKGVPQDDREAVKWYRLAANQGDAKAQFKVGWMSALGRGKPQNDIEALHWYRLAAEQGDASAQSVLGSLYFSGVSVPQDYRYTLAMQNRAEGATSK